MPVKKQPRAVSASARPVAKKQTTKKQTANAPNSAKTQTTRKQPPQGPVKGKPVARKQVRAKSDAKKQTPDAAAVKRAATTATKKTAAKKPTTKKLPTMTPARGAAAKRAATAKKAAGPGVRHTRLKVREDEAPWTEEELAAVRGELEAEVSRLSAELSGIESDILGLMADGGDGAGDDQADAGTKTFEREHEFSLAQNSRDLLVQAQHALERIEDGSYGTCESCGNPIGKMRLQAFPRATLCMACKQKQERH